MPAFIQNILVGAWLTLLICGGLMGVYGLFNIIFVAYKESKK